PVRQGIPRMHLRRLWQQLSAFATDLSAQAHAPLPPTPWSVLFRTSPVIVGRSPGVAGSVAAALRDACHASGLTPCAHICASLHRGGGSRAGTSVLRRGAATGRRA